MSDENGGARPQAMQRAISAELIAVLVSTEGGQPGVLTLGAGSRLPCGPFAIGHRSLQAGLRTWVEAQTRHPLGYLEQLYTFADRGRGGFASEEQTISISYLGLTHRVGTAGADGAAWRSWYDYFPWEDQREPAAWAGGEVLSRLQRWAGAARTQLLRAERQHRVALTFAVDGHPWNEELVLQRYELLYEAGLVPEALRDGVPNEGSGLGASAAATGIEMAWDHRRILATGIARLRAKIKYRPLVFELMPPAFTLLHLQRCVEGIAGHPVHKQNFRRLIEQQALVEETGDTATGTGGRPAKLFRFRRALLAEREIAGSKPPTARS